MANRAALSRMDRAPLAEFAARNSSTWLRRRNLCTSFSTISECLTPVELVHFINDYLSEMCDIIEGMGAAAKASGAGGGDCGVALVHPTVERDALERAWRDLGVVPLALSVTATEGDHRVG